MRKIIVAVVVVGDGALISLSLSKSNKSWVWNDFSRLSRQNVFHFLFWFFGFDFGFLFNFVLCFLLFFSNLFVFGFMKFRSFRCSQQLWGILSPHRSINNLMHCLHRHLGSMWMLFTFFPLSECVCRFLLLVLWVLKLMKLWCFMLIRNLFYLFHLLTNSQLICCALWWNIVDCFVIDFKCFSSVLLSGSKIKREE